MSTTRKILLIGFLVLLTVLVILTWGSIFSAIMAFCLIASGCSLLLQHFVLEDRDRDYFEGQDG